MRTVYLKSNPVQSWQKPTYYKITGSDNNIKSISIWNATSLDVSEIDDETFNDHLTDLKQRDLNHPIVEISRKEFDDQYLKLTNKLNELAAA